MRRLVLVVLAGLAGCGGGDDPQPPNIVLFLADDLGWGSVGYHGGPVRTPHVDRLAREGTRLERFYVQPTCSPTRAALLTGRYPIRLGFQLGILRPWADYGLGTDEYLLSEALRDAGYETAIVGKWHLGHVTPGHLPTRRGFEHQYGFYGGTVDYFEHTYPHELGPVADWNRDDAPLDEPGYATDLFAAEAVRRVHERDPTRPLFLFVSFSAPHVPLQVAEERLSTYAGLADPRLRTYAAMITCMDEAIGDVRRALDEEGIADETLIVFASDNGALDDFEGNAANAPLRGGKGSYFEGGVRVPAVFHWPGRIPAGATSHALAHVVDLYPTLLAIARGRPGPRPLDGVDLRPLLFDGAGSAHEEVLLNASRRWNALVRGDLKLIRRDGRAGAPAELYDLAADPGETTDLAARRPELVAELSERLGEYEAQAVPPLHTRDREPEGYRPPARWGH